MNETATKEQDKINGFDKWEVQDAARTLIRAEEIRKDKRSNFYSTVKTELKRQAQAAAEAALENKVKGGLKKLFKP